MNARDVFHTGMKYLYEKHCKVIPGSQALFKQSRTLLKTFVNMDYIQEAYLELSRIPTMEFYAEIVNG